MKPIGSFCVLGGDDRQGYLAEALCGAGYPVRAAALDQYSFSDSSIKTCSVERAIEKSDCVILPLPVTMDSESLSAPLTLKKIMLNRDFVEMLEGKQVFAGQIDRIPNLEAWHRVKLKDYYRQEPLIVGNAVLTAEAAISLAIQETPYGLLDSKCLVVGFGRIGKALAMMLRGMGGDVTVSARRREDFAWIRALGLKAVQTGEIGACISKMNIVFNAVPSPVLSEAVLERCPKRMLIIDLASPPGGVDFIRAEELGIKAIWALNLPGKYSPKSAAELIKTTVMDMVEEVNQFEKD